MFRLLDKLWNDDIGALYATEWVLIAGIAVFGLIPGLVAIRNGTNSALGTQANTLIAVSTGFSFSGYSIVCGTSTIAQVNGVDPTASTVFMADGPGLVASASVFVSPCP